MLLVTCVYNTLSRWARRIKKHMGKIEFRTSLLMILIPLSFGLVIEAYHTTDTNLRTILFFSGGLLFIFCIWFWNKIWEQIKINDRQKQQEKALQINKEEEILKSLKDLNEEITKRRVSK